jgi:hypothetical protein
MATEGIRQTMYKRGINAQTYLMSQQKQVILQKVIVGPNALPYMPFKRYRGDNDPTVRTQRHDEVDYAVERNLAWNRLARRSGATGMLTAQDNYHPVLISEREMARLGQRFNPSVGLLYSTEGPLQERHADDEILRQTQRQVQPSRVKFGGTGVANNA